MEEEILMEAAEAEAAEILIGLRDLVPAATPEPDHRRIFPRWERKRRRSNSNNNNNNKIKKGIGRERLSPATPLSFGHSGGDTTTTTTTTTATKTLLKMSQHKQWLKEQKQWIDSLISTKISLQKSVEEAKRRCQMLRERNCWLRSLHAGAQIKLRRQQQQQQAFDLNRSAAAAAAAAEEEARVAWQRRMELSAQARKRRMLLQRAKFSPSSSLALWR